MLACHGDVTLPRVEPTPARLFLWPLVALSLLPACGKKTVTSAGLAGSFVRQDALVPGLVTRLHVTPTGLVVTTPTVSVESGGSLQVGGKPFLDGSTRMELGLAAHGAALFETVVCEDEHTCSFTTKSDCAGTLTGDGKGNVVLIAMGACEAWSAKWMAEKDEPAHANTCPPPPACPPAPSSAPAPLQPPFPQAPWGAPPGHDDFACMTGCNTAYLSCVQSCKVGDMPCQEACMDQMMACMDRCW